MWPKCSQNVAQRGNVWKTTWRNVGVSWPCCDSPVCPDPVRKPAISRARHHTRVSADLAGAGVSTGGSNKIIKILIITIITVIRQLFISINHNNNNNNNNIIIIIIIIIYIYIYIYICGVEWSGTDLAGGGSHRGRAARSSPPPSQGLRKRHRPSGEVQFAKTAPDPGGPGGQAGDAEQQAAPRGRGGGGRERPASPRDP